MSRLSASAWVAALPWNQWQLSPGMGGRLAVESVATLLRNTHLSASRIHPTNRLHELLPYHWEPRTQACGENASGE